MWGYPGQDTYFSNLRITHSQQLKENGSQFDGIWDIRLRTDQGPFAGSLTIKRDGRKINGMWSGALGDSAPVSGTWREGYVEFGFTGSMPRDAASEAVNVRFAGWVDGSSATGNVRFENTAAGRWTGARRD